MDETNFDSTKAFDDATRASQEFYVLRLYITGMTPRSIDAVSKIRALCEKHLEARYSLEIIDIYQQPELAKSEQIVAIPTLVKELPVPLRRLIGRLSDEERVLAGLALVPKNKLIEE